MLGEPLVDVRSVEKHYAIKPSLLERAVGKKEQVIKAVDGVDLQVFCGETLGLVGESGCGKSTLGRTILQLHAATAGQILYEGRDISNLKGKSLSEFRKKAQIIFQNPYSSLNPRKTVKQIISLALEARGLSRVDHDHEIRNLLIRVGLSDRHMDNYPHQFSGGQRQRIGIARALAMKPRFVVADEPVSALDVSVQAQIINLLQELQQEYNLTYLFVAHDLSVINYVSNRVAVMYLGKIVEVAKVEELFANPLHPYAQALLSAIPKVDKQARTNRIILEGAVPSPLNPPTGCTFHTRCFCKKGSICERERPKLIADSSGHAVACHNYST